MEKETAKAMGNGNWKGKQERTRVRTDTTPDKAERTMTETAATVANTAIWNAIAGGKQ